MSEQADADSELSSVYQAASCCGKISDLKANENLLPIR